MQESREGWWWNFVSGGKAPAVTSGDDQLTTHLFLWVFHQELHLLVPHRRPMPPPPSTPLSQLTLFTPPTLPYI
jgi:hypothetical protein